MVQIISENRRPLTPKTYQPSMAERLKSAGASGIQIGLETLLGNDQKKEAQKQLQIEDEAAARIGANLKGIRDPKQRQQILASALQAKRDEESTQRKFKNQMGLQEDKYQREADLLKGREEKESNQNQLDSVEDEQRYNIIKEHFGDKAADIYKAATEGGKTAILNSLLESGQRGMNFEDLLPKKKEKVDLDTVDYDKGLTPKERAERQEKRYSSNLPLYQESQKKKEALESASDRLNILQELSPKIGAMERLNINPNTGELIIPALASEDAQRYIKTVNDFTVAAKDSFGGRVTNFDLDRFMKRLPTLANSEASREEIIRQMQIINDMNLMKEQALQEVIDEHGGIRNIDFDTAERMAEKKAKPKIEQLKSVFKAIDKHLDEEYKDVVKQDKAIVPKGRIAVQRADGSTGYIPQERLKDFLKIQGNKKL